jgi:general secretion pathway protein D
MPFFNRLVAAVLAAVLVGPAVPLEAKTRKGDRFLSDGRTQERKKDWDGALNSYERALSEDPSDVVYQMAAQKTRFQASQAHLDAGFKARAEGQLGDALIEFQRAFGINPGSSVADQEIRRTQQMIERERRRLQETGKEASPEEKALTPSEEAKKQVRDKIERMLPVPELKPLNNEPINLKMNNQTPKVLFETVAKVAGLNVIWDPEYQPGRNLSIELNNSTYDEALDDLAILTKSFWKPLSANTIFITNDNRNKRNDYEEQVLKVFYLSNVNTPQELQEIVNAVRAVTELTRLMPYNSQNAIIARGEADRVALAEKIITDLDKPKAEVVIDVLVLQASQVFSRKITAALAPTGLNVPVNFTPRGGLRVVTDATTPATTTPATTSTATTPTVPATTTPAAATNAIPLQNLGRLASSDFSITLPGALLQAALSDATTKILQSPQVRSVDNVKASLKIGEREPTATGSFQPGIGGVGINPLVNTQFTYIDVGVNVDLTPRVHDNNEISMHVDLDISSVAGTVNLGGIEQPIIQQNKISHDLRVREGEVSLLAGLVQHQESKSVTGIPGLSSIPLIRRLFSGESVDRNNSELMIALIPHIVRRPDISPENLRGIAVGNATTIKLNYAPLPSQAAPARPAAAAPVPAAPPAATPAAVAPPNPVPVLPPAAVNAPPATAPPPTAAPLPPGLPPATAPAAPPPAPNTPPAAGGRLFFQPAQVDIGLSAAITVAVAVDGVADVASAPMQIQFDPRIVRLNNVSIGDFLAQGGSPPSFTQNILNDTGTATIQLARLPGTPGASGTGVLVNLNFQAVGRGAATVTIPNLTLLNSQSQVVARGTPQLTVNVK